MAKVLLLKGESKYDAMRNYIDEIEIGFRLAGYDTYVIDLLEESYMFQLQQLAGTEIIDIIFTCNATVHGITQMFPRAVYITYLCDHPSNHIDRLKHLDNRAIVFTCDALHEQYIRENVTNIQYVKYIPLSGSYVKKRIPYQERKYEVVFTGSYQHPQESYHSILNLNNSENLVQFVSDIADLLVKVPELDIQQAFKMTLEKVGGEINDKDLRDQLMFQAYLAELYARDFYRDQMIRSLIENGIQVHVFGEGWDQFEGKGKENLIIEKGNFYVARKAVANAKISLNIMPWFKAGFQERIATAMLSGAVAVTDESAYISENFENEKDLVIYSLRNLKKLPSEVKRLLENPQEAERIALLGELRAKKSLTWQHRTLEMVEYIQKCAFIMPEPENQVGERLQIPFQMLHEQTFLSDKIQSVGKIIEEVEQVQQFDRMEGCDINYFYTKLLSEFMQIKANCPEITATEFVYDYLTNLPEGQEEVGAELLKKECQYIQAVLVSLDRDYLKEREKRLQQQLNWIDTHPNQYSQKMIIQKIKKNYGQSKDNEIQEILKNITASGHVGPYNQDFAYEVQGMSDEEKKLIQYDSEAGMWYALWKGKRMYYPKGRRKEDVIAEIQFVYLEQDIKSPHRYLDESFDVNEGDIVVEAGVAEGNFGLEIVDKVKKLYLVECEHIWVEALQKTFEPWKDKVTIIEKMLGDKDEAEFASIDGIVTEGYANFIKMDIEGAEMSALKGAVHTLENSRNIKCAICSYHRKNAERDIRNFLEQYHFYTTTTQGYMFFKEDLDSWIDGELRRGLVRAVKISE